MKHIVSWIVWTVVGLYATVMIAVRTPWAQRELGTRVSQLIEEKLGTKVEVGRIDLGFLNRLIMDDVVIYDQQKKQMVNVARMTAKVDLAPLALGRFVISSAQIFGARFQLYRSDMDSPTNFQFVLDSLASKDTTSQTPLDLSINSFILRRSSVTYDQWDEVPTPSRFNPYHVHVAGISAHIILKALKDDSLNVNVKRLTCVEQSGLNINRLAFKLAAGNNSADLRDFSLQMPGTVLHIDSITAFYERQRLKETFHYLGSISRTEASTTDFCWLFPALKDIDETVAMDTRFEGTFRNLNIQQLKLATKGNSLAVEGSGEVSNWNGVTAWNSQMSNLFISSDAIQLISEQFIKLPEPATRLGDVTINGTFEKAANGDLTTQNKIQTSIGDVDTDLQLTSDKHFTCKLSTDSFNLHRLLDDDRFGHISTDMTVSGNITGKTLSIAATGVLSAVVNAEPIATQLEADLTPTSITDAVGTVSLRNLQLPKEDFSLNLLQLESGFTDSYHFVTLVSDFAQAQLTGQFDYATLMQSITNFIGSKLPTLPGLPPTDHTVNNNFALQLTLLSTDWLVKLWDVDLQLHEPLTLSAVVNDNTQQLSLASDLPSFSYDGSDYRSGRISIATPKDTAFISAAITKLAENGHHLGLQLHANAADNNLTTSLTWDNNNPALPFSGRLNTIARLYRNLNNEAEAHFSVLPSVLWISDGQWQVEPSDVLYTTGHLLVDHFAIHKGGQYITIDGTASKSSRDSLFVDLNDVEVAYILNLVDFDAVEFTGMASGRTTITASFDEPSIHTNLIVNNFRFEKGRMGVLSASVDWNKQLKQIDIRATADDGPNAQTYISGYVSPERDYLQLDIQGRGTYIDFMHSFTDSFLSEISGHAHGDVRLSGPLSTLQLTGQLIVDGHATVTPLGTTYNLRCDTVVLIPDEIELHRVPVYDKYDNTAYLSGGIHHQHLTNLTFDLSVNTDNLLAYDFPSFGDESFCGTVFAAGSVNIQGRPGRVTIDCNITPQKNTVFTYNASQTDAIANQEFITWKAPDNSDSEARLSTPASAESTDIYLNFLINTTPDATMRLLMDAKTDDYITLNGSGTLRATYYNKGAFQMFGTYTTESGTYDVTIQNIIKKKFNFNPGGTIVFGGDPYDAALTLQAVYTVNGVSLSDLNIGNSFSSNTIRVNCLMNIGGQPKAPQVDFDLEMPTVNADEQQMVRSVINGQQEMNQQVLYLLGIGRFYAQGQNNADQQTDQTSLAMQSLLSGTLSTQINTVLNQVIKNDSWNFGANISTGTEGWNNAEYEGIINGRMLNNRLLINGQFGYRDGAASAGMRGSGATQANPSFIGDFDIRYLLYPNGNLALKVYNQTNDRYFTKSSLNTQGIGVIMKKDFNTLSDLFIRKKKKEKEK